MKKFLAILAQADLALLMEEPTVEVLWEVTALTGEDSNQVVRLNWLDGESHRCSTYLTEENLNAVAFSDERQTFLMEDYEGSAIELKLVRNSRVLSLKDGPVYMLIQEGGSSAELYIHAHETFSEAENDRVSCADDGSYRTSEIIEVPSDLAAHPKFFEVAEQLARATLTLDYPEEA